MAAVSYYQQIRPIFPAHCQGCHQPVKASGAYEMTNFARLVASHDGAGIGNSDSWDAVFMGNDPRRGILQRIRIVLAVRHYGVHRIATSLILNLCRHFLGAERVDFQPLALLPNAGEGGGLACGR